MSVTDALHDWKQLAESAVDLKAAQEQARELQLVYERARAEFEEGMEDLDEDERATILSIMAIYDEQGTAVSGAATTESAKTDVRNWLVAKIGNEGPAGISWGDVLDAFVGRYPDTPTTALHGALHQGKELFTKNGLGRQAVLHLTPVGQTLFRDAE
jgi:hypothetical protein